MTEEQQRFISIEDAVHTLCVLADNPPFGRSLFLPALLSLIEDNKPELFRYLQQYAAKLNHKKQDAPPFNYEGIALTIPKELRYYEGRDLFKNAPETSAQLYILADEASCKYYECRLGRAGRKREHAPFYIAVINACLETAERWERDALEVRNLPIDKLPRYGRVALDLKLLNDPSNTSRSN